MLFADIKFKLTNYDSFPPDRVNFRIGFQLGDNEKVEEVHTIDGAITTWTSRFQTHKCYNLKIENICKTFNVLYQSPS